MKKILLVVLVALLLVGCGNEKIDGEALYKTIDYETAKEFVDSSQALLIDVRTYEEYEKGHIEEAINVPLDTISEATIKAVTIDQLDNIIVYCESGERSKEAAIKILELGYTNVYDLGSMDNWKIEDATSES